MNHKCPKCNAQVPDEAKFCPECGTAQKKAKSQKSSNIKSRSGAGTGSNMSGINTLYMIALLSIVVVGIYGYKYFVPPEKEMQNPHVHETAPAPQMDQGMLSELRSKVAANPDGFAENVNLGNFLFDNERYSEALNHYKKALNVNPNDPNVIVDAGVCYFNLENYPEARKYFKQALEINSEHPNALYNLGIVSAQTGDMEQMLDSWNHLIEVAPESGPAQTAKQLMDQIKNSQTDNP